MILSFIMLFWYIQLVFIFLFIIEAVSRPTKTESNRKQGSSTKRLNSNKQANKHNKKEILKKSPQKNIANTRLSQLRERLSLEMQKEENDKSPVKRIQDASANVPESPSKIPKLDPKPQSQALSQSPNSDSVQSIPSPSQFLAANKIISSMKAQLPEEYCSKSKQKDTFADIEQGKIFCC